MRYLAPALILAAGMLALEATSVDRTVADWFFDANAGVFPLRHSVFLEVALHQWAKQIVVSIAGGAIAALALSHVLPSLRRQRRVLLYLVLALTLAPLSVALLKAASLRHCPWSLVQYGGFAPYFGLFDAAPPGLGAGNCFPAGHASTGFCLMAFHFAGHAMRSRRLGQWGLYGGIAAGLALGLGRMAQGAHFLSHVLWSGIVCWMVIVVLYVMIRPAGTAAVPAGPEIVGTGTSGYGSV
jgi:membrane-associated PAP2 superfamily phosphatase